MKPEIYVRNVLEGLEALSSYNFQRLAWFPNDEDIMSSFNEDVMCLYDALGDALYKKTVFDKETDSVLRELRDMVMDIPDDVDERELIDAPEMEAIRQKAAEALRLVQASDHQGSTVEIIED